MHTNRGNLNVVAPDTNTYKCMQTNKQTREKNSGFERPILKGPAKK